MAKPKHAALLSLPPPVLQELDNDLRKGLPTKVLAGRLHQQGLLTDTSLASLERELRKYRRDTISVPEAARVTSIQRSPNPETQALLLKKAEQWDAAASWQRLIQSAEKRYWKLAEQFKNAPIPPDSLRRAANELSKMYEAYNEFLMETGVVRRVPRNHQHLVLRADQIQVRSADDAGQLVQALTTWLSGNEERLPDFTVKSLENLVTKLKINDALHMLHEAAGPPTFHEHVVANADTKERTARLLRIINGEEDEQPEIPRVPLAEQYVLEHVPDPDERRSEPSPERSPLLVLDRVDRASD